MKGIPDQRHWRDGCADHREPPQDLEQLLDWGQVRGENRQQACQSGRDQRTDQIRQRNGNRHRGDAVLHAGQVIRQWQGQGGEQEKQQEGRCLHHERAGWAFAGRIAAHLDAGSKGQERDSRYQEQL